MGQKRRHSFAWPMLLMLVMILSLSGCSTSGQTGQDDIEEEALTDSVEEVETAQATEDDELQEESDELSEESSGEESKQQEREYPYDYTSVEIFTYENWWFYVPVASTSGISEDMIFFQLNAVDGYQVMQGGCSDGTYIYMLLSDNNKDDCMLFKIDPTTWEIVAQSESLDVDHGNGITYNSSLDQLIVAHCINSTHDISFINPETLTVEDRISLDCALYSIAYSEIYEEYVVGIKGSFDFAVYDADFNQISYYSGQDTGLSYQNVACDDDYIYFTHTGDAEAIICYDWSGNYCGAYLVDQYVENEALIQLGDDWYMSFYSGQGGRLYRIDIDTELIK